MRMMFRSFCRNRRAFLFRRCLYCRLCTDARTTGTAKQTQVSLIHSSSRCETWGPAMGLCLVSLLTLINVNFDLWLKVSL